MSTLGERLHQRELQWMRDNWASIRHFHRKTFVRRIRHFGQTVLRPIADAIPYMHPSPNRKPR